MDVTAGTLILWLGWFYFNGASASTMYAPRANSTSRIYMNCLVAAGAADENDFLAIDLHRSTLD